MILNKKCYPEMSYWANKNASLCKKMHVGSQLEGPALDTCNVVRGADQALVLIALHSFYFVWSSLIYTYAL